MRAVDLLGWSGSVLVVLSLTQSNMHRLRLINLAASLLHLTFNLFLGLIPMIALNAVLTGVNCFYLSQGRGGSRHTRVTLPGAWRNRVQLTPS